MLRSRVRPLHLCTAALHARPAISVLRQRMSGSAKPKDVLAPMASIYSPSDVERGWYPWWESKGFFKPSNQPGADVFSMVIPPPNDVLVRYHRMRGRNVVWVPGLDHAGIATQVVVEKQLMAERKQTRHDLGRDKFVEEVWKWKEAYGGQITKQLRKLGVSLDWSREVFTMDKERSAAVVEAFVRLHEQGQMYRATRLVNWCSHLNSAISDIEVEYDELAGPTKLALPGRKDNRVGVIHRVVFPVEPGAGGSDDGAPRELAVDTTRVETLFGDTAVAVHPADARYAALRGRTVRHPLTGRSLPIVFDDKLVDPALGTGVVKITPAHDWADFECAQRHKLPSINVMNDDGTLNSHAGRFAGQDRFAARAGVVAALQERGAYGGSRPHAMRLARCSRSGDVLEPRVKPQWFVRCAQLGAQALRRQQAGQLAIQPERYNITWKRWLEDVQDWCVSRQLWWGHRVPAYRVVRKTGESSNPADDDGSQWIVARSEAAAAEQVKRKFGLKDGEFALEQDPDVLDTWFSSSLFPLSVHGWPQSTPDLAKFYPLSVMETGADILFFWVARMTMMCTALHPQQTPPFSNILLHPVVRDVKGRKMSKSVGNVIDPLAVIEGRSAEQIKGNSELAGQGKGGAQGGVQECGADGLRLALALYMNQDLGINLDLNRVLLARNFCNKLWQASRFVVNALEQHKAALPRLPQGADSLAAASADSSTAQIASRWILARLQSAAGQSSQFLESRDIYAAANVVHSFVLHDFCDVFIEFAKPTLKDASSKDLPGVLFALLTALESALRLLHPFMPFITEELWQRVRSYLPAQFASSAESIMVARFPVASPSAASSAAEAAEAAEREMRAVLAVLRGFRSLKQSFAQHIGKDAVTTVFADSEELGRLLTRHLPALKFQCRSENIAVVVNGTPDKHAVVQPLAELSAGSAISVPLQHSAALEKDVARLAAKLKKSEQIIADLQAQMAKPGYAQSIPEHAAEANRQRLREEEGERDSVQRSLAGLRSAKRPGAA